MFKILYFVCLSLIFTIKIAGQQDTIIYNPNTGNYTLQYIGESSSGGDTLVTLTYIPWTKLNPFVKCDVFYDSDSSEYIYNWEIGNDENSEQNLKKFVIVFGENAQVVDRSTLGWHSRRWKGSENGEVMFLNRWGWTADQGLEPTWNVAGLKLGSSSLPSIGFAYFQGKGSIPKFPYAPPPIKIETEFVKLDGFPNNYVRRETIVPRKLSAPFIPLNFLDTLLNYNQRSYELGWITNQSTADKYFNYFNTAKTQFQQNNSTGVQNTLQTVLQDVDQDSSGNLTSEAYALLKYNTEYLLENLPEPVSNISTYSLFATHSMWLKENSDILSGDIGVNEAGSAPFLDSQVELAIGIGVTTPAGYSIKANRIKVKQSSTINGDVYYNELDNNGTIAGSQNTPLELPLISTLPEFKSSTPGTNDIVIPINGEQTLQPGNYGTIQVKKNGKLVLTGGEYNINVFNGGIDNQIVFQSPSEVRIADKFDSGQGSYIGPEDTTTVSAKDIIFYVGGINGGNGNLGATPKAAIIGISNNIKANFYVPNGTLWIKEHSGIEGMFIAKDIEVGIGVEVQLNPAF